TSTAITYSNSAESWTPTPTHSTKQAPTARTAWSCPAARSYKHSGSPGCSSARPRGAGVTWTNRATARPGTPRTVATSTTVGHVITAPPSTTGHGGSRVPPTTEPRSATRGQPSQPTCPDRVGESVPRRIRRRVLTPVALLVLTGPVRII